MKVDFFKHNLSSVERDAVGNVLKSTMISTGPITNQFESLFSNYFNVGNCVGVTNWTTGALMLLKTMGISDGDEVITSPLSFIATSNAIIHSGAIPVFVDVEPDTGNIDVNKIENAITSKTKGIMPVHLYGQMCDMKKINQIAKKHNLFIIEDCAHAIESVRDDVKPGQLSTAALFSFYATKNITCGEGGAIISNDKDLIHKLRRNRLHGMSTNAFKRFSSRYKHWDMVDLGYKCNMNDIQASLLIPQLNNITSFLKKRQKISKAYDNNINFNIISKPKKLKNSKHALHLYTIWVQPEKRDSIIEQLQDQNIGITVNYRSIHNLDYYKKTFNYRPNNFPNADQIGNSTISLPFYPKLKQNEVDYVINSLNQIIGN